MFGKPLYKTLNKFLDKYYRYSVESDAVCQMAMSTLRGYAYAILDSRD